MIVGVRVLVGIGVGDGDRDGDGVAVDVFDGRKAVFVLKIVGVNEGVLEITWVSVGFSVGWTSAWVILIGVTVGVGDAPLPDLQAARNNKIRI